MDSAGFNAARWDHWLLIMTFVGLAIWGIRLSRQWKREPKLRRDRLSLSQLLNIEIRRRQGLTNRRSKGAFVKRWLD